MERKLVTASGLLHATPRKAECVNVCFVSKSISIGIHTHTLDKTQEAYTSLKRTFLDIC